MSLICQKNAHKLKSLCYGGYSREYKTTCTKNNTKLYDLKAFVPSGPYNNWNEAKNTYHHNTYKNQQQPPVQNKYI